jgi:hypothetical protein
VNTEQDMLDSLNYIFKLTRCESEEERQAVRLEAEEKKKEAVKRIEELKPKMKRGELKRIEKERREDECYKLYDEFQKNDSKESEPLRKAKIARRLGVSIKTVSRYLQARD